MAATSRKRSCAVCLTVSTRFLGFLPGTSTTMFRPPCVETSASVTPVPLTRWSMIPRASSRLAGEGFWPFWVAASSVIRCPPCRSRPSLGFHWPLSATPPYRAATTRPKMISRRPGRAVLLATATRSSSPAGGRGCSRVLLVAVGGPLGGVVGRRGLRVQDPHDRLTGHLHGGAGRQLQVQRVVLDGDDRAVETRTQHHLRADGQGGLRRRQLLLATALGTHDQEPEDQRDQDERQETCQVFHGMNTSSTESGHDTGADIIDRGSSVTAAAPTHRPDATGGGHGRVTVGYGAPGGRPLAPVSRRRRTGSARRSHRRTARRPGRRAPGAARRPAWPPVRGACGPGSRSGPGTARRPPPRSPAP